MISIGLSADLKPLPKLRHRILHRTSARDIGAWLLSMEGGGTNEAEPFDTYHMHITINLSVADQLKSVYSSCPSTNFADVITLAALVVSMRIETLASPIIV